jgi:hypothetical protein
MACHLWFSSHQCTAKQVGAWAGTARPWSFHHNIKHASNPSPPAILVKTQFSADVISLASVLCTITAAIPVAGVRMSPLAHIFPDGTYIVYCTPCPPYPPGWKVDNFQRSSLWHRSLSISMSKEGILHFQCKETSCLLPATFPKVEGSKHLPLDPTFF